MSKLQSEGWWYFDPSRNAIAHAPKGEYEESELVTPDIVIGRRQIPELLTVLEENGWLKPRIDEQVRVEDLKITHRCLDLAEKLAGAVGKS